MKYEQLIFLVGLGAPIDLYKPYLKDLQRNFPNSAIQAVAWWNQSDLGKKELDVLLKDANSLLIAHSAGGFIGLQALMQYPATVQRVIMLDTHLLGQMAAFPPLSELLPLFLRNNNAELNSMLTEAYAPIIENSTAFFQSFRQVLDWSAEEMERCGTYLISLPIHTVLHIGFTDNTYHPLNIVNIKQQQLQWNHYNIDTEFTSMYHFDFILPKQADAINSIIINWL